MKERKGLSSVGIFTWGMAGGAFANVAASLSRGLLSAGIKKVYIIYLYAGPPENTPFPNGIELISLNSKHSGLSSIVLGRVLKQIKPDVLISLSVFINIAAVMGRFISRQKIKLVLTEHALLSYKVFVEHKNKLKFKVLPSLVRFFYPKSDGIIAIGEDILKDLTETLSVPLEKIKRGVIPNPLDLEKIKKLSKVPLEHPWFKKGEPPVILSVGRLARQKNFPLLMKAFAMVLEKREARLLILGDGPDREDLEKLACSLKIDECTQMPGYEENPYRYMAASRLFVLSSEEEAFGLVLVEALETGTPVIATDAKGGGPKGILKGGGTLVPAGDVKILADTILKLLEDDSLRKELIDSGRRIALNYSPGIIGGKWVEFMETL